ncbi:hypothetical protein [Paenibacillus amylolyticus]|uniref:hypothetical protein n=1 Tax=Paenibacillus amylolyticus TaxID=1451 RepID=UPI00344DDCD7
MFRRRKALRATPARNEATGLAAGPFLSNESGRYVVPPDQAINLTVSGSLSVGGLMASTAYFAWWEV